MLFAIRFPESIFYRFASGIQWNQRGVKRKAQQKILSDSWVRGWARGWMIGEVGFKVMSEVASEFGSEVG